MPSNRDPTVLMETACRPSTNSTSPGTSAEISPPLLGARKPVPVASSSEISTPATGAETTRLRNPFRTRARASPAANDDPTGRMRLLATSAGPIPSWSGDGDFDGDRCRISARDDMIGRQSLAGTHANLRLPQEPANDAQLMIPNDERLAVRIVHVHRRASLHVRAGSRLRQRWDRSR
ncbi:MAG: hypothetical protein KatS3mg059_1585 [Thermomicrobiales bacterium]|nr:MAG: hypothetical protein KatS3mg059_1585 [Thermomicrobiales bacterium]